MGVKLCSLTLREERRLRVFENMVLRIFEPIRDEVTGELGNNKQNYSSVYLNF